MPWEISDEGQADEYGSWGDADVVPEPHDCPACGGFCCCLSGRTIHEAVVGCTHCDDDDDEDGGPEGGPERPAEESR